MESDSIECPDCGQPKGLASGTQIGQILNCAGCGALLEVLALSPPEIGHAPQIEEDFGE
ncbi:Uncharacterised protein [uncultured archaeon]|nr:Uncharacterised protein [uncultured archaeon]